MTELNKQDKINTLLIRFIDNDLDDKQREELLEWSQNDPDAYQVYWDFVKDISIIQSQIAIQLQVECDISEDTHFDNAIMDALALEEKTAPAIETPIKETPRELIQKVVYPPIEKRPISKFSIFSFITSAAAILLFIAFLVFAPPQSQPVASITGDYNAVWENLENTPGSRLWNDGSVYRLQHGTAEITFDSGAKVLLESPADLEVMDENEMFIKGLMTANVPQSAYGFTVNTVNSKVVDLGTEFGLTSSVKNGTNVHVRKGKVQHVVFGSNTNETFRNLVEAGQASCVSANGSFSKERFQGDQFRWVRPTSYETAVLETSPVAYYRFEKGHTALGFDEISRAVTQSDSLGLVNFVSGPNIDSELQNQSLHLTGEAESKVFVADTAMELTKGEALSISLWVCPEQVTVGGENIITYTGNDINVRARFTNQLYLTDDNRVGFYLFDDDTEVPIQVETQMPVSLNRWSHITAGYSDETVRLYVNGQLQASHPVNKEFIPQYFEGGYWAIGAETGGGNPQYRPLSMFIGSVDELSFYGRQLSDTEVKMLYEAAKQE